MDPDPYWPPSGSSGSGSGSVKNEYGSETLFVGPNLQISVLDPDSLNSDPNTVPDPAFLRNPDTDPDSGF